MTPAQFCAWLASMKEAGRSNSDAECADLLGMTPTWIARLKRKGTSRAIDLACSALYMGHDGIKFPWQEKP